jgi:hypothetical protein
MGLGLGLWCLTSLSTIFYSHIVVVSFISGGSTCSVNDYAIATNKANDDGIHPMVSSGLVFDNVAKDNH